MLKLIKNARIITCNTNDEIIENGSLVLKGDQILEVNPSDLDQYEGEVIDLQGKTILPGLINAHLHFTLRRSFGAVQQENDIATMAFRAIRTCLTLFREGVTAGRDLGHMDHVHIPLRNAINSGIVTGPRIKAAGDAIVMSYGHAHFFCHQVHNQEDIIKEIRRQINSGVDFIKIIASHDDLWHLSGKDICKPWFETDDLRAAADMAHLGELKITAHANGTETIRRVIEAGFDCVEHGIFLDEECAKKMKERNMFLVPTLSGYRQNSDYFWKRGENWTSRYKMLWEEHQKSVRHGVKHGVQMAAGTDTLGGMAEEIELLQSAGLSNMEAIKAGTINGAKLMEMENEIGSIEKGKKADLCVIDGNPLVDISSLRNVTLTIKGGIDYPQEMLDRFIQDSELYPVGS